MEYFKRKFTRFYINVLIVLIIMVIMSYFYYLRRIGAKSILPIIIISLIIVLEKSL